MATRGSASSTPAAAAAAAAAASAPSLAALRNELGAEQSPYLRQHASNPVHWQAWGERALRLARELDKPILLSVGYSTCHWCHVMEHESFDNAATAALMNEHFVCIKMDREERPDVDAVYMTFVQALSGGHGGWPMTVFMTPDLKPYFAGTYFPPGDVGGRTGFRSLLLRLGRAWATQRALVVQQSERLHAAVARSEEEESVDARSATVPSGNSTLRALAMLQRIYDDTDGGFGGPPKFPQASIFTLLLHCASDNVRPRLVSGLPERAAEMLAHTLQRMARGGILDHLAGGFHRYSVDGQWIVPHFEKMLYDQAQLAVAYAHAGCVLRKPELGAVAERTLEYVRDELGKSGGAFWCAQDADSVDEHGELVEGAFYVWTQDQVEAIVSAASPLGPRAALLFCDAFGVEEKGNAPEGTDIRGELTGKNVLHEAHTPQELCTRHGVSAEQVREVLASGKAALLAARGGRRVPHTDDKVLASWNGLAISAMAFVGAVQRRPDFVELAVRAAAFVRRELYSEDGNVLSRCFRERRSDVPACADDYAYLVGGLLDLYESTLDEQWLQWARRLQAKMDAELWSAAQGGYYDSQQRPDLVMRRRDMHDGAEPSPNSVAARNLLRLFALTSDTQLVERATALFKAFGRRLEMAGASLPAMVSALGEFHCLSERGWLCVDVDAGVTRDVRDEVVATVRALPFACVSVRAAPRAAGAGTEAAAASTVGVASVMRVALDGTRTPVGRVSSASAVLALVTSAFA